MYIQEFFSNIKNEEIDELISLDISCHEWIILRKLDRESISRNKTIGEKDLRQAFPSDKLDCAKNAIDSLFKKGIIEMTPKPTARNYHCDRTVFKGFVVTFLEEVTKNEKLRKALIDENLEFTKTSDTLVTIVENKLNSKSGKTDYSLKASDKKAFDGNLGLVLDLKMRCKNNRAFEVSFEILYPNDLFEVEPRTVKCECGDYHTCVAYGIIINNSR
jgi:hypothetical protein